MGQLCRYRQASPRVFNSTCTVSRWLNRSPHMHQGGSTAGTGSGICSTKRNQAHSSLTATAPTTWKVDVIYIGKHLIWILNQSSDLRGRWSRCSSPIGVAHHTDTWPYGQTTFSRRSCALVWFRVGNLNWLLTLHGKSAPRRLCDWRFIDGDFVFQFQTFLQNLIRLFDMDGENCLAQDKWIEHLKGRLT